jgi:hypothetical protein
MVGPSVSISIPQTVHPLDLFEAYSVSAIGFGAMGLSPLYGAARTDDESRAVVQLVSIGSCLALALADPCGGGTGCRTWIKLH